MTSSCCHSESGSKFFSFFARSYRKRFEKKGFEESQKQMLAGLDQVGYADSTILEIGCGVGYLHHSLIEQGAQAAAGIDLSPKMLSEARDWADEKGLGDNVNYVEGDFMQLDDSIDAADVCLMDKVICCYPDAPGLISKSLAKTRKTYALTYPRDRWFVRLGTRVWTFMFWLVRSDFRSFVHDPTQIESWISGGGLEKRFEDQTAAWVTQVYVRT